MVHGIAQKIRDRSLRTRRINLEVAANKAFQMDAIAVSHLLQKAQKLRHGNSAPEQRRYAAQENQLHAERQ